MFNALTIFFFIFPMILLKRETRVEDVTQSRMFAQWMQRPEFNPKHKTEKELIVHVPVKAKERPLLPQ